MAKTKEQKQQEVKALKYQLTKMKSLVFIDYYGLKANEVNQLRRLLEQKECQYLVAKKTLLKLSLKEMGLDNINLDEIEGGIGLAFGFESETAPAKLVVNFAKEHGELKIQGGIFEKEFIGVEMVKSLSRLPSKAELLGQFVGTIKGPVNNFVYTLKGNLKNFVYLLSNINK